MKGIKNCIRKLKIIGVRGMDKIKITASTHPAKDDILNYVKQLQDENVTIDMLHVDIMDGKFVEDKTFDYKTVKQISEICTYPLDVHLMVENPYSQLDNYINAGANIVTVHFEAFKSSNDIKKALKHIKNKGCLAGISIKPATRITQIAEFLDYLDMVLIMSVEPGKSGQKFIIDSLQKISQLRQIISHSGKNILIEVDGGVNSETIEKVRLSGADMVVCGSALYKSVDKNLLLDYMRN